MKSNKTNCGKYKPYGKRGFFYHPEIHRLNAQGIKSKLTPIKLKALIKDESMAVKEYNQLGLKNLAKDEAKHEKFLKSKFDVMREEREKGIITAKGLYKGEDGSFLTIKQDKEDGKYYLVTKYPNGTELFSRHGYSNINDAEKRRDEIFEEQVYYNIEGTDGGRFVYHFPDKGTITVYAKDKVEAVQKVISEMSKKELTSKGTFKKKLTKAFYKLPKGITENADIVAENIFAGYGGFKLNQKFADNFDRLATNEKFLDYLKKDGWKVKYRQDFPSGHHYVAYKDGQRINLNPITEKGDKLKIDDINIKPHTYNKIRGFFKYDSPLASQLSAKGLSKSKQKKSYKNIFEQLRAKHGKKKFDKEYSKETKSLGKDYDKSLKKNKLYSELSKGYKKAWILGAEGISIDNLIARGKVNIGLMRSSRYDTLPEERDRNRKGEMSYAQTKISPRGISITIRDSHNPRLNRKLLQHEREELMIFNKLKKRGVRNAEDLAHDLTHTKVNNREVDKAYGDIGDPI